jgi:hypothetical protein
MICLACRRLSLKLHEAKAHPDNVQAPPHLSASRLPCAQSGSYPHRICAPAVAALVP